MIRHVACSQYDLAQLWARNIGRPIPPSPIDFRSVVVDKPWGYEYLAFENDRLAIWILFIKAGASTSMHTHLHKRTSLLVLKGAPTVSFLDQSTVLAPLDGLVMDSGVFHCTHSSPFSDTVLMEVEVPSDKGDLVRLRDEYGRENRGYEGVDKVNRDLKGYEYCDISSGDLHHIAGREIEMCRKSFSSIPFHSVVCVLGGDGAGNLFSTDDLFIRSILDRTLPVLLIS